MKRIVTGHEDIFGPWMMQRLGSEWTENRGSIIGLWDDAKGPVGSVLFESYNGASVLIHAVGADKRWLNRDFLWFCFHYPFEQLKVTKIIGPVESTNTQSRKFIEGIGFILEATLKEAAPKGDLLLYTMTKDQCRWLTLKEKYRGKTKSTRPA